MAFASSYPVSMLICPACGQENPEIARFCLACATQLAVLADDPGEERRVVSVVFVDLVGSTARGETLDPEDVRALLAPYHEAVRSELERFGGVVEKFIGDAVMAIFGAPRARGDDAERAVRAAFALRDAIDDLNRADPELDLHVRIGINTGEALVELESDPRSGEGIATGDVVNTAARLQTAAPVAGILVGEATRRATARAFEYAAVEPVVAKGKHEPVLAWQPVALRVDPGGPCAAPLVGRERELELLLDRVASPSRLVTLVGVPGLGKTRLLNELCRALGARERPFVWRQ